MAVIRVAVTVAEAVDSAAAIVAEAGGAETVPAAIPPVPLTIGITATAGQEPILLQPDPGIEAALIGVIPTTPETIELLEDKASIGLIVPTGITTTKLIMAEIHLPRVFVNSNRRTGHELTLKTGFQMGTTDLPMRLNP